MGVNMYDGLLVPKNTVDIDELNETTNKIGIKWIKKSMDYEIEEGLEHFIYRNCMVYSQFKKEFEKNNFFIKHPFQLITKEDDEDFKAVCLKTFKESNTNIQVQALTSINKSSIMKDIKLVKFVDVWADDPNRLQYDTTCYFPFTVLESKEDVAHLIPKNSYNVFNKFDRKYIPLEGRL